ncbi:cuticle protein 16.5 [Episyrphus balteatus]|uniref:cuticle protein 16.5 n=1 Tax=Episyrphus balteatus TaxID=286459 RepID=UPI002485DC40|nr:cuticle protein 16.5 [Episyrphus balteatus]
MKLLILCSLIVTAFAAPGGLYGYGGLGLGHGIGLGGIAIAAPAIHAAPAPVLVQQAPTIVKAIAPAATSSVSISQVHIQHPSPVIKYAAAPAVAVAQPIIKYAAAPAISVAHPVAVAQPVIKYAAAPSIISGLGGYGYGGHGIALH